jgi:hypothetical protein
MRGGRSRFGMGIFHDCTSSTEALSMIFKDADAAGLEPDARLTAMWLWTIGGGNKTTAECTVSAEEKVGDEELEKASPRASASSAVKSVLA